MGDLKHYTDPEGHVFSMTEERAKLFGYDLAKGQPKARATAMPAREAQPADGTEAQPGEAAAEAKPTRSVPRAADKAK